MSVRQRSSLSAIGERTSVADVETGSDIWYGTDTTVPVPPDTGELMEIVCSDSDDIAAGAGVQEIGIHYLDADGVDQFTTVATNGGTYQIPDILFRFIQDIHATQVGSTGVAEGDIVIRSQATPANVFNMIKAGGNMSLTINKMVPAGKTLFLTHWDASASGKQSVVMRLRSTDMHGQLFEKVFIFKDSVYLENSSFLRRWEDGELWPIPELSLVKVSVWCDLAGADVSAGWTGVLIDDNGM